MTSSSRSRVFLDISIDNVPSGRLVLELFNDKAPKTSENFRRLCAEGYNDKTYTGCSFHRIIDEFMIQGGDIQRGDGTGTLSIYDGQEFEDENLSWREIDAAGLLCSANRGKNTNGSQFFITLEPSPHLNGKHTVFGRLVAGDDVLQKMAKTVVDDEDRPKVAVVVSRCGELERKRKRQDDVETAAIAGRGRPRHSDEHEVTTTELRSPPRESRRRPSDNIVDEGLRGRPRKRSKQRNDSHTDEEALDSAQHSPVKVHKRKRSASPSRERDPDPAGYDNSRRRRRSLPNQYNDYDRPRERRGRYGDDNWHDGEDRDRDRRRRDDRRDDYYRDRQYNDRSRRADRWHPNDGRLSNDDRGSSDSGVKFKGRGVMKYREPGRLG